jgi:hypothetical protein
MNTLILHAQSPHSDPFSVLATLGGIITGADEITLSVSGNWIRVTRADDVMNDYEQEEKSLIFSFFEKQRSFLVEWRGDSLLHEYLSALPKGNVIVVDNDHGIISPLDVVVDLQLAEWIRKDRLKHTSLSLAAL